MVLPSRKEVFIWKNELKHYRLVKHAHFCTPQRFLNSIKTQRAAFAARFSYSLITHKQFILKNKFNISIEKTSVLCYTEANKHQMQCV